MYYLKLLLDIMATPVVSSLIDLGLKYLAASYKSPMAKEGIEIVRAHYREDIRKKD